MAIDRFLKKKKKKKILSNLILKHFANNDSCLATSHDHLTSELT